MKNNILINILRTFSKVEIKRFEDLVNSPYFNKNSNVKKLFQTIKKYHPDYTGDDMKRENIWKRMFAGKDFNYGVMKNLIHELNKLADKFMELQTYESDKLNMDFNLLSNILSRPVDKIFNTKYNQLHNLIENKHKFYPDYFRYLKKLNLMKFESYGNSISQLKDKEKEISIDASETELYYSLCRLIKSYCFMKGFIYRNNFLKDILILEIFLDGIDFKIIFKKIEILSDEYSKILNIYYKMYIAMRHNFRIKNYLSFKELLIRNHKYFDIGEKRILFNILESSLTINSENTFSVSEYFELDKLKSEFGLLIDENNVISFTEFAGIIKTASSLKEIQFLKKFVENYIQYINPSQRTIAEEFSNVYLKYISGDYDSAMNIILKSKSNYFEFRVDMKLIQMKIYYEQGDFINLEYKIDALKHYLNSEKVNELYKSHFLRFCNLVSRLYKLKESGNKENMLIFRNEINSEVIPSGHWFSEMINIMIEDK